MAKTISQLPDATVVNGSDELIIQQSGVTKRATKTEVLAGIVNANIDAAAAIAGTKIAPTFVGQEIVQQTETNNQFAQNIAMRKSRSGSIVQSGDQLGRLLFEGFNGTDFKSAALIAGIVGGTPGAGDDMPGALAMFTSADGTATLTERMRIDASGNVGIGTSSPQRTLHVAGNARIGGSAGNFVEIVGGSSQASFISQEASAELRINQSTSSADSKVTFLTQGTERMRIDASGNVGIGTSSPAYTLDVNGIVNTSETFSVDGTQVVSNRRTGWSAATGTATRSSFATSTVTTAQLAERVKALIDDLTTHGLIGT